MRIVANWLVREEQNRLVHELEMRAACCAVLGCSGDVTKRGYMSKIEIRELRTRRFRD